MTPVYPAAVAVVVLLLQLLLSKMSKRQIKFCHTALAKYRDLHARDCICVLKSLLRVHGLLKVGAVAEL